MNLAGKVSWFGGPADSTDSGHTANGETTKTPGIAVYNHGTLGGYWRVKAPNGKVAVLKQTDIGPAPWTGRKIDVTYSALGKFGFNEHDFPTDSHFEAEYLGRKPPKEVAQATTSLPGTPRQLPATPSGAGLDKPAFEAATKKAILGKLLSAEKGAGENPLLKSGLLTTKAPDPSEYQLPAARTVPGVTPEAAPLPAGKTVAYVNPLSGFAKGRTDQGVDASAAPGTPIKALGNARVLGVSPNWYKGQPYVSYELLDGPERGKVVFVAEQITPAVRAGQHVRAGQAIGHYAPTGTGIEMGFGTRTPGQTLAKATTGYTEGQETQAGKQFKRFVEGIK
jgi:hypothetical protein